MSTKQELSHHKFNIPVFIGEIIIFDINEGSTSRKKLDLNDSPKMKKITQDIGCVRPGFIKEYILSSMTKPHKFADIFFQPQSKK